MKYKSPGQSNPFALLPFIIFIAIYLGAGLYFQAAGVSMAFYQFPSVTAMFIAVLSAFCLSRDPVMYKFGIFSRGAGNDNIMTMLMIYILAGAFSAVAAAMGGRDATVNLGMSLIPPQYLTVGIFLISAFMGYRHRYLHGHGGSHYPYCGRHGGKERPSGTPSFGSLRERCHVWRQSVHDFRYHHCRHPHPGLRFEG